MKFPGRCHQILARREYDETLVGCERGRNGELPFCQVLRTVRQMPIEQVRVGSTAVVDFKPIAVVVVVVAQAKVITGHEFAYYQVSR